ERGGAGDGEGEGAAATGQDHNETSARIRQGDRTRREGWLGHPQNSRRGQGARGGVRAMVERTRSDAVRVDHIAVSTYRIPTETPEESDGTYVWRATTMVLVEARGGGVTGIGYSYADESTARLIHDTLSGVACDKNVMALPEIWTALVAAVRNLGRSGIASMAISAVDTA